MPKKSALEQTLLMDIRAAGLPEPECEYKFHPTRRWRFDLSYVDSMLAFEIEGGTWSGGRHTTGAGFHGDCIKYNEAALMGWRVFRFDSKMVADGTAIETIKRAYEELK